MITPLEAGMEAEALNQETANGTGSITNGYTVAERIRKSTCALCIFARVFYFLFGCQSRFSQNFHN